MTDNQVNAWCGITPVRNFYQSEFVHRPVPWPWTMTNFQTTIQGQNAMNTLGVTELADQNQGQHGLQYRDSWFLDPVPPTTWSQHGAIHGQNAMNSLGVTEFANQNQGQHELQHCDSWFLDPVPPTTWSQQTYEPSTISPKVLTLNSSTYVAPVKCPDILNNPYRTVSAADIETNPLYQEPIDPPRPVKQQPRKRLPVGKPTPSLPSVPTLTSSSIKKVTKHRAKSPRITSPILKPTTSKLSGRHAPPKCLSSLPTRPMIAPKKAMTPIAAPEPPTPTRATATAATATAAAAAAAAPNPKSSATASSISPVAATVAKLPVRIQPAAAAAATEAPLELLPRMNALRRQESKDNFLVRSKRAGMSYKDIRKAGNFTEAESTLRGRYRTLTKEKEARVRKPEWQVEDIRLLKKAVRKLSRGQQQGYKDSGLVKVPWKQVADYISDNGGSYHFGNATCRKKWDELCVINGDR